MVTSAPVRGLAIHPRLEPVESDDVSAFHEFGLPPGAGVPVPYGDDADEMNGGGSWQRRCVWQRAAGAQLRCVWA